MTHQPRIPEAAQSPYPLHPAPMPERSEVEEAAPVDAGEEAGGLAGWASQNRAGLGAAIGIGSAALVAALLYSRYNRRDERDRRAAGTRKPRQSPKAA